MRVILLLSWLLACEGLNAQTFSAAPASTLQRELAFNEANECYIYFDNLSGDTLQLKWRQLEMSLPEGWTADLCDYGLCYTGIPANGTMNPVFDTIRPYLKLIVQPNAVAGAAWIWFRAIELGNDANYVDVYFNLFTAGTVSVKAPETTSMRLFPNPASNVLFVENKTAVPLPARLTDLFGRVLRTITVPASTTESIDLAPYPTGYYFLQMPDKTEKVLLL
jgi:hypothetical protein